MFETLFKIRIISQPFPKGVLGIALIVHSIP